MTEQFKGVLEIDADRGVIWFHHETGSTVLRICSLPSPIPVKPGDLLDITYGHGVSWSTAREYRTSPERLRVLYDDLEEVFRSHDFDTPDAPYNPEVLAFARAAERVAQELSRRIETETTSEGNTNFALGEVWRVRRGDITLLVLVIGVTLDEVLIVPVTIDPPVEDGTCLVVDKRLSGFGVPVVVWLDLHTRLPISVFDELVAEWDDSLVSYVLLNLSTEGGFAGSAPAGIRKGMPDVDTFELPPARLVKSELAGDIKSLQAL